MFKKQEYVFLWYFVLDSKHFLLCFQKILHLNPFYWDCSILLLKKILYLLPHFEKFWDALDLVVPLRKSCCCNLNLNMLNLENHSI